jgi:uncharacterized membrane-anchored protein
MLTNKRVWLRLLLLTVTLFAVIASAAFQEAKTPIKWQAGPGIGKLGEIATIAIPKGYNFTGKDGTQRLLELTQNPTDGDELGAIVPAGDDSADNWFVIFEFESSGYVRDSEKDSLDADAILANIQKGTEESNKTRADKGWAPFHVVGWSQKPFYASDTHNLTWSIIGQTQQSDGKSDKSVNHSVRILGRRGVMRVDLVLSPERAAEVVPEFNSLMSGFTFTPGQTYSDWRSGDKVAEYGLTGLIVGGGAAVLLKTGLLAKFWKLLVVCFAAIVGFIKRAFAYMKRLIKGKGSEESPQQG